ncbi:MAG: glycosyltransferase [Candidatus Hinthialibacter antarcticus]|nr:glycosyltransferase [Candidatus Hinthialibacter antarcticus]
MAEPPRVLQVVASLHGGAARHVLHLSKGLIATGWKVTVASPCDDNAFLQTLTQAGCEVNHWGGFQRLPIVAYQRLRSWLQSGEFDLVHVHGHRAAILTRAAAIRLKQRPPIVYTVHGYHPPYYPKARSRIIVNSLERMQCGLTDEYICVSPSTQADLARAVPKAEAKSQVIANAVPVKETPLAVRRENRNRIREALGVSNEAFVLGTVARLQWQKGVDRLLQAFQWAGRESDVLLIVGDGPDRNALQTQARRMGYGKRCLFIGAQNDARPLYHAMDLFVLPSLWEGLPLTVLEAWANSVPVVATDVAGSRDLIIDGVNGLLAQNHPDGIAAAIHRFHKDNTLDSTLIRNGLESLERDYSLEGMIEKTEAAYRECLK